MNPFARELFARLLAATPRVYGDPKNVNGREHTDEELDALVKYALRAEAACERESKRYREAHPVPPSDPKKYRSSPVVPQERRPLGVLGRIFWALVLAVALVGCERSPEFAWRDRCDVDRQERVFLECLRAAQHMGGPAAPGNDSDEVIDSCGAEARAVACVRAFECVDRCSEAAP